MNDTTTIKALMIYKVIRRLGLEDERTINLRRPWKMEATR